MPSKKKPKQVKVDSLSKPAATDIDLDALIRIVGEAPPLEAVQTGIWSLDKALGGGWPRGVMTETYGKWGVGKSTFMQYVAGVLARDRGGIVLADFEKFDPRALQRNIYPSGFSGDVYLVPDTAEEKKGVVRLTGEERLDLFMAAMEKEEYAAGILDAVGSIVPAAETEEDSLGEAHMGILARLMAKFARRTARTLRCKERESNVLLVNHEYQLMMGRGGSETPGGNKIKYLSALRIKLWVKERFDDGSLLVQGESDKVKFDRSRTDFRFVICAGRGVHPGLSAVQECKELGLVAVDGGRVAMGGKSFGYFKHMLEKWSDAELFSPFLERLEKQE